MNIKAIISLIVLVLALALAGGCAPVKPTPAESAAETDREASKLLETIEADFKAGNTPEVMRGYQEFLNRYPQHSEAPRAMKTLGDIYFQRDEISKAKQLYQTMIISFPGHQLTRDARLGLAKCESRMGNHKEAVFILRGLSPLFPEPKKKIEIFKMLGDEFTTLQNYSEALMDYVDAYDLAIDEEKTEVNNKIKQLINDSPLVDLVVMSNLFRQRYPESLILFRLINVYREQKKNDQALEMGKRFLAEYPKDPLVPDVKALTEDIGLTVKRIVGVILPMSGPYQKFGELTLKGMQLAAGVSDPQKKDQAIELVIKDCVDDPEAAAQAVAELAGQSNVMALVGPLRTSTAQAAAKKAQELAIPIITLTQAPDITAIGDYSFRNFITVTSQTKALVEYATKTLNLTRFAVLFPKSNYGETFMSSFWDQVSRHGGELVGTEAYQPNQSEYSYQFNKLTGLSAGPTPPQDTKPTVNFQALFIPDDLNHVRNILPYLSYHNLQEIRILGTNLLHNPQAGASENAIIKGVIFPDAFFKDSPKPAVRTFMEEYFQAYGAEPDVLAAFGYDTIKILQQVFKDINIKTREDLREAMYRLRNFDGVTGVTSFNPGGDVEKSLFILTVDGDVIRQLN
ncbi:MAG: penicillin-binding protein activator [Deltaproteobacteria bacterium]|nr:penicillin-binding protein activator [Deltaproteobacteria bacterium]